MSISGEFFKTATFEFDSVESMIAFFVENYTSLMRKYRFLKKEEEKVNEERKNFHRKLQGLRESKASVEKKKTHLDYNEKIRLEEYEKYLHQKREEVHKSKLPYDQESHFVVKHLKVFEILDKHDYKFRGRMASKVKKSLNKLLIPCRWSLKFTHDAETNLERRKFLRKSQDVLDEFENFIYDAINGR